MIRIFLKRPGKASKKRSQKAGMAGGTSKLYVERVLCQICVNQPKVDLVNLSIKQSDTLTILLTGRGEDNFANLIKRIVESKNLVFDMICLKPQVGPGNQTFTSTMKYKQAILRDLIYTYKDADEVKVYEDRVKQSVPCGPGFLSPLIES